eukprot:11458598-Alexandrium_andersonii.AAC.1
MSPKGAWNCLKRSRDWPKALRWSALGGQVPPEPEAPRSRSSSELPWAGSRGAPRGIGQRL